MLEDNRNWYCSRIGTSSSSSSGTASARQVSSPADDESPTGTNPSVPVDADSVADDVRTSTAVESANTEDAAFIASQHPDAMPLQRTSSRGVLQTDNRCPHPEIAIRRTSEAAGSSSADGKDSAVAVTACSSDVAVNGGPSQHQSSPASVTIVHHKPVAH